MKKRFIGVYDYTVILTYTGLVIAVAGIIFAGHKRMLAAVFCLCGASFCDMFDGKIASTKKGRTEAEKLFGMQIDSLCDMVSFGVLPCVMFANLGKNSLFFYLTLAYYGLCSLIRLGYFNVLEIQRTQTPGEEFSVYHGLPVIAIAVLFPCLYTLHSLIPTAVLQWLYCVLYLILGTLYILDFPVKKPGKRALCVLSSVVGAALLILVLTSDWRI